MYDVRTREEAFQRGMLQYFNRKLLEKKIITQDEFRNMGRKILQRK